MTQRKDIDQYFNEVKADLTSKLDKATSYIESIESKLNETETNRQQSAENLAALNKSYNQTVELINETRTDLSEISALRSKAFDTTTGIEPLLARLETISDSADKTAEKIEATRKNASSYAQGVKEYNEESRTAWEEVRETNKEATEILGELQKTYELAVNTGLAGSFDSRAKVLKEHFVDVWQKRFTRSLVALGLLAAAVVVISYFDNFNLTATVFFRLGLLSPLIFYTGYTGIQYAHERSLYEKYAFKAVVATSLESYTNLLVGKFGKDEVDRSIPRFVIATMHDIYMQPQDEIKRRTFGFGVDGKLAKFKTEVIEEIKDTIRQEHDGPK